MTTVAPNTAVAPAVTTLLRYVLSGIGTLMVSRGIADQGTVDTFIGAALVIIPVVYGVWLSYRNSKTIQDAEPYVPNHIISKQ